MWQNHRLFNWLLGYEQQRKKAWQQAPAGPLKDYLNQPGPDFSTPVSELELLSVDFETTGLDARVDKLLSVGFCHLAGQQVQLRHCYHQIINAQIKLSADNVAIHHITDEQQQSGQPLEQVVTELLTALTGKAMLVHYHPIEKRFLQQACLSLYGVAPPLLMIDTLVLAKRRLELRDVAYDPSDLRLISLRKHHQLPNYHAHNALSDAIATAEVYLAETASEGHHLTLRDLLL